MKKFVIIYGACCLIPLLGMVLVTSFFGHWARGAHPDQSVLVFVVSAQTFYLSPWRPIFLNVLGVNSPTLPWVLSALTWGAVLYAAYRILRWLDNRLDPMPAEFQE